MKKLLVKLNYCWADEFDVDALWVTDEKEYADFLENLKRCKIDDSTEICFGTNEYVFFGSYEEIVDSLTVSEISDTFFGDFMIHIGQTYGLISIPDLVGIYEEDNDYILNADYEHN